MPPPRQRPNKQHLPHAETLRRLATGYSARARSARFVARHVPELSKEEKQSHLDFATVMTAIATDMRAEVRLLRSMK